MRTTVDRSRTVDGRRTGAEPAGGRDRTAPVRAAGGTDTIACWGHLGDEGRRTQRAIGEPAGAKARAPVSLPATATRRPTMARAASRRRPAWARAGG
jgi:hypothetical protein